MSTGTALSTSLDVLRHTLATAPQTQLDSVIDDMDKDPYMAGLMVENYVNQVLNGMISAGAKHEEVVSMAGFYTNVKQIVELEVLKEQDKRYRKLRAALREEM